MKWLTASLIVLSCFVGCHAPTPSFNVLAPYGSARVPPPATSGNAGQAPYYTAPTNPTGTGTTVSPATLPTTNQRAQAIGTSQIGLTASTQNWRSVQPVSTNADGTVERIEGDVRLAAYNANSTSQSEAGNATTGSTLRLSGMTVHDATQATTPPGTFAPAPNAAPIPQSTTNNTVSATAQSSSQPQPKPTTNSSTGTPTLQWGG